MDPSDLTEISKRIDSISTSKTVALLPVATILYSAMIAGLLSPPSFAKNMEVCYHPFLTDETAMEWVNTAKQTNNAVVCFVVSVVCLPVNTNHANMVYDVRIMNDE